jgi:membrane protease YdiL (CAAX protease family)
MRPQIKAAWDWLPVIVRAIVLGWVLLTIGSTVTFLPLLGNLKFHPEIPWAFPITLVILALYWAYFSGWGPPAGTRDARKRLARASLPSARIWRAAIPAIVFGIIALVAMRLLLPSLLPVRAPSVSISLSSYPLPTIIGALLSIAVIAAVTEEIAFRGYMQKPLEEAYGNDRTRRCRHSPSACLLFPPSRICLEGVVRTTSLGGCCLNISRETVNNRIGTVAQALVRRRPFSNLRDRRLGLGDKHAVDRVRFR